MLGVDLLAKMVDHHVYDVRPGIKVIPPSVLGDQRPAHHAPGVTHEILEDGELLRREVDQLPVAPDFARGLIEHEVTDVERWRRERFRTASQRLDAREQLL